MIKVLINIIIFIIILITITKLTNTQLNIKNKKNFFLLIPVAISILITIYLANKTNSFFIISILTNLTLILLYKVLFEKYRTNYDINYKNLIMYIFIGLSTAFILETTLFNFCHYQSLNYQEKILESPRLGKGIKEENGNLTVEESGIYTIEFPNINTKIHNIYINVENINSKYSPIEMSISYIDEANVAYVPTPSFTTTQQINKSFYHKIHTSGKSEKIGLNIRFNEAGKYVINEVKINSTTPFEISKSRIALITFIIFLCYIFGAKSKIYKLQLLQYKYKKTAIIIFVAIEVVFCSLIFLTNTLYMKGEFIHHKQYQMLAHSFKEGKTNLDYPVSDILSNLSNPYDPQLRSDSKLEKNVDYCWDTAFYNKKYYVYFGVLPVVTAYLPYNLITGKDLANHHLIYVMVILTILSCLYLVYQIIKRWFPKTSIGMFFLLSILLINSSGLLLLCKCHDLYSVPIVYSLFFASFGLGLWISAYDKKKNNQNIYKLMAGSLCMALVAGCRPQFLISSFFIFPIFISYFIKDKKNNKRKTIELCALLVPYIIVAIPLMIYNYVRFDSIFDFGANYNLTTNDMTKRGFVLERIFTGLYYMLLAIPDVKPIFPFLNSQVVQTTYLGITINEPLFGGFLICNVICIITLFLPKLKKQFEQKEPYYLALLSTIFAFIIIIADTQMAGILVRYTGDFGWLFILGTILTIFTLNKKYGDKNLFIQIISILVFTSVIYSFGCALFEFTYYIKDINQTLFEQLKYLICFWL